MKTTKITGLLFILGALGVFIPYTILNITFDYPDILRQDVGLVLTKFHQGGNTLILTWWLFAILGLPMLVAYKQLGMKLENKSVSVSWLTTIGIIGLVVQMIGLLRWTFVVPILASNYYLGNDTTKEIAKAMFQVVHQYGGVVLGEHLGQLFTIIWVIGITRVLQVNKLVPVWINWLGYGSSFVYLFAQAELFATVIPSFPVWDMAGFVGSTLWLVWLISLGVDLIRTKKSF
ncbi:DUF4386 domain-containing protein [Haliscomenobacter hydrossis]|uniref:DUF4386 domain-containing protein n=1 Tax=Haliscomenobacter hydrossis (strain ATCC 27775 / DSM 1100 / LMG 10767 / O) TaxID=760192 RepID=F4L172_HALH1|nr:DUF4386 domain-containing protein [Haliscomenobacter hydrossis]AEE52804.1 hypothetical protein Halhy_4976 [Haliscomenobacter hydrossis DSM 1100]